jgi:DNA-binding cell septation regulator SpoVG
MVKTNAALRADSAAHLRVTSVNIHRIKAPRGKLVAFATIILNEALVISGLQIIKMEHDRHFVSMPGRQLPNGEWRDDIICIDSSLDDHIKTTVLRVFEDELVMERLESPRGY